MKPLTLLSKPFISDLVYGSHLAYKLATLTSKNIISCQFC